MNPKYDPTSQNVNESIYEFVPQEFSGENPGEYMQGDLEDLGEIPGWVSASSLEKRKHRVFSDFEIYDAIDGAKKTEREVSLVIAKHGSYPQHTHNDSDAFFVVVEGTALFKCKNKKFSASVGTKIKIPRGTPHGFEIRENEVVKFISIQNPPIKNHKTGEEDFHLYELI